MGTTKTPTNLREARDARNIGGVEKLRDLYVENWGKTPSKNTWGRADAASATGEDPADHGLDPLTCMFIAKLLDVPVSTVSRRAAKLLGSAREVIIDLADSENKEGQMGSHRELVAAGQRRARPPDPSRLDEAA